VAATGNPKPCSAAKLRVLKLLRVEGGHTIKGPHGCLNSTNIYLCIPIGGRGPIYGTISLPAALVDTTCSFSVTCPVQGTAKGGETQIFAPIRTYQVVNERRPSPSKNFTYKHWVIHVLYVPNYHIFILMKSYINILEMTWEQYNRISDPATYISGQGRKDTEIEKQSHAYSVTLTNSNTYDSKWLLVIIATNCISSLQWV
jgi:hypothetical protein